ncbi:MAG: hypothetical protein K2K55_09250, partial [Duncaniella sp.]|nr:hypothetical protein [Duncaniella sp.]
MEDKKDTCMNLMQEYPASFRVLGIGEDTKEIIERIKEFGFEGVSASVVEEGEVCGPTEETKLAFIVSVNDVPRADSIAKSFHEAGVLTLGLSPDADPLCYDSVGYGVMIHDYPSVVKEILKPVATPGYISYDFAEL